MDIESGGGSDPPAQFETTRARTYAQVVSGRDTSVFRPTPAESAGLDVEHVKSTGQSEVHFMIPTVPVSSRPIRLLRNGCQLSPLPSTNC